MLLRNDYATHSPLLVSGYSAVIPGKPKLNPNLDEVS